MGKQLVQANKGKALLIDDYPPHRLVSATLLENLGFEVDLADCGEAALDMLAAAQEPYQVIIMDVQMQQMNGMETTRLIRELEKQKGFNQPILGVTAHALATDRERYIATGMTEFMSKPIHPDMLAKKIGAVIRAE